MIPKLKAEELFNKFKDLTLNVEYDDDQNNFTAKQCALIAIDEIIDQARWLLYYGYEKQIQYWQQVKLEIEKL